MLRVYIFLSFVLLTVVCKNPCDHDGHRRISNIGLRYVYFKPDPDDPVDDSRLIGSWYYVGNFKMPDTPPPFFSCGVKFPIWLQGGHPKGNEIVNATGCTVGIQDNCTRSYDISIIRCPENFYLYNLTATDSHDEGYCFGTGVAGAKPDFVPAKPHIKTEMDKILIQNMPVTSVRFVCAFAEESHNQLYYQVSWIRENVTWYTTQHAKSSNNSLLHVTEDIFKQRGFQLGETIACTVRAYNVPNGAAGSRSTKSNDLFVGIKVLTKDITLLRGESANIQLQPTIPIGCFGSDPCSVYVTAYVPKSMFYECNDLVLGKTSCGIAIESTNVSKIYELQVQTAETGQYLTKDSLYEIYLKTDKKMIQHKIWADYRLPRIKVHVHPKKELLSAKKECYAVVDPHLQTFDGRGFDNHQEGVFIMYRHEKLRSEVQIRHQPCNRNVDKRIKCPCGVAVSSGRDVYIISVCVNYAVVGYKGCGDDALTVKRFGEFHYEIYLPHGTFVKAIIANQQFGNSVGTKTMNVYVYPSRHDEHSASRGLCGQLNGDCHNDFHYPNGSSLDPALENGFCTDTLHIDRQPKTFIDTWKVKDKSKDMFNKDFKLSQLTPWQHNICLCEKPKGQELSGKIECKTNAVAACSHGIQVGGVKTCGDPTRQRRSVRGSPLIPDVRIPDIALTGYSIREKRDAADHQWTMDKARDFCTKYMSGSPVFSLCQSVPNSKPNGSVEICAMDIVNTNGTEWSLSARENMQGSCLSELRRNLTLRESSNNQTSLAEQIEEKACPNNCSGIGSCIKGACQCQSGFGASDCSIDLTQPPLIAGLLDKGLCDEQGMACDEAFVFGSMFTDSHNLTCRLIENHISLDGDVTEIDTHYVQANLETFVEITCPLHHVRKRRDISNSNNNTGHFVLSFNVSVSNDGTTFDDGHILLIYNSQCQEAIDNNGTHYIILRDGYCFIDNHCVSNGQRNHNDNCSYCEAQKSTTEWTFDNACIPQTTTTVDKITSATEYLDSTTAAKAKTPHSTTKGLNITAAAQNETPHTSREIKVYQLVIGIVGGLVVGALVMSVIGFLLAKKWKRVKVHNSVADVSSSKQSICNHDEEKRSSSG